MAVAKGRGVEVAELPLWMERRKRNQTKLNREYMTLTGCHLILVGRAYWNGRLSGLLMSMVRSKLSPMTGTRPFLPDFL